MEYTDADANDIDMNTMQHLFKISVFALVILSILYIVQNIDTVNVERLVRFFMVVLFTMIARSFNKKK